MPVSPVRRQQAGRRGATPWPTAAPSAYPCWPSGSSTSSAPSRRPATPMPPSSRPSSTAALRGEPLPVHGTGEQTRDFTYVGTVTAVLADARAPAGDPSGPVNLAFGTRVSLLELIAVIERQSGTSLVRDHLDPRAGDVRDSQADQTALRAPLPRRPAGDARGRAPGHHPVVRGASLSRSEHCTRRRPAPSRNGGDDGGRRSCSVSVAGAARRRRPSWREFVRSVGVRCHRCRPRLVRAHAASPTSPRRWPSSSPPWSPGSWRSATTDPVPSPACAGPAAVAVLVELVIKPIVGRQFEGVLSYPSGNVADTAAVATAWTLAVGPRLRPAVAAVGVVVTLAMAIAVIGLRWHYPSDALGRPRPRGRRGRLPRRRAPPPAAGVEPVPPPSGDGSVDEPPVRDGDRTPFRSFCRSCDEE